MLYTAQYLLFQQIGRVVGSSASGIRNIHCNHEFSPLSSVCEGTWEYYDGNSWKYDDTITMTCQEGNLLYFQ